MIMANDIPFVQSQVLPLVAFQVKRIGTFDALQQRLGVTGQVAYSAGMSLAD
jgi:hypothetical protein